VCECARVCVCVCVCACVCVCVCVFVAELRGKRAKNQGFVRILLYRPESVGFELCCPRISFDSFSVCKVEVLSRSNSVSFVDP
jgi:hypothetical protein